MYGMSLASLYFGKKPFNLNAKGKCSVCGETKSFSKMKRYSSYGYFRVFAICMVCDNRVARKRYAITKKSMNRIMKQRFNTLHWIASKKAIPFEITFENFIDIWERSSKSCPILGTRLDFQGGKRGSNPDTLPSLDKVNPDLGYVKGNLHFISFTANRMKQNITLQQAKNLVAYLSGKNRYQYNREKP